ncbi:DNA repair protein RadA [Beutenbergia cavernae]|nr:DNA repair protein RadA [Beutenbergia cavernae]
MTTTPRTARTPKAEYRCAECGWQTAKWVGRCGECQAWGTVEEAAGGSVAVGRGTAALAPASPAVPIDQVDTDLVRLQPTGVGELDRVLGGGLVPGAVVLLAGEPGVGKSTLLLDVAAKAATSGTGRRVLYVTGEESASQVRLRAERIGALRPRLYLAAESDLATVLGQIEACDPQLLVLDSVQTIASADVDGAAGGVAQVRAVAAAIIAVAKRKHLPVLLVGHVTKDGGIAGPRVLEHLVDVVCQFEGDRHSRLRMVRAVKNRYGPTDEVGCFDLTDSGIEGLPDPSGLFLSGSGLVQPGTCATVTLDGRRPMPIEIQALVTPGTEKHPRRATSGVESSRVNMTLAVLQALLDVRLGGCDVFVSTIGGARAVEPAADIAVALAVASAETGRVIRAGLVAIGEVSLAGELRPTVGIDRRLAEAARLGFTSAVVPARTAREARAPEGLRLLPAASLAEAAQHALAGLSLA